MHNQGKATYGGPDDSDQLEEGEILVTERTDRGWVPVMKRAAVIVTDHGSRTILPIEVS